MPPPTSHICSEVFQKVRRVRPKLFTDAGDMTGAIPEWRGWESPRAGQYYSLEGPDADAVGMPPAPALKSIELEAEMAEVYALALLRDVPFTKITSGSTDKTLSNIVIDDVITALTDVEWYDDKTDGGLTLQERRRRAARFASHAEHDIDNPPNDGVFNRHNVFRGSAPGVQAGPYISQFMVLGTQLQEAQVAGSLSGRAQCVFQCLDQVWQSGDRSEGDLLS